MGLVWLEHLGAKKGGRSGATERPAIIEAGSGNWGWPVSQRDTPTASGDGGKGV